MELTQEQIEKGEKLYRDMYLLCEGWNPRPELERHVARKTVTRESLEWLEQFKDALNPNTRPYELLCIKNLFLRVIDDETNPWDLDDVRASLHYILDSGKPDGHHYDKCNPLWRDGMTDEEYNSMKEIVKKNQKERWEKKGRWA